MAGMAQLRLMQSFIFRCDSIWLGLPQVGFKLLAFDVRVSSGLVFKAIRGNALTR